MSATPRSVTIIPDMLLGIVTALPKARFGTIREIVPFFAEDDKAVMLIPPADRVAASVKSKLPPTPLICRKPTVSELIWPVRSISIAELILMKFLMLPR
jgi:hypothetical protein